MVSAITSKRLNTCEASLLAHGRLHVDFKEMLCRRIFSVVHLFILKVGTTNFNDFAIATKRQYLEEFLAYICTCDLRQSNFGQIINFLVLAYIFNVKFSKKCINVIATKRLNLEQYFGTHMNLDSRYLVKLSLSLTFIFNFELPEF